MKLFCLLLMMGIALTAASESYYSINAPGLLKPNRKLSVVVALHEAPGPSSIRVGIEGPNYNEFQNVDLQPLESRVIDFFPKQLDIGVYYLKAEGLSEHLRFQNESVILAEIYDGPNIYIQTDKAIYKPEDIVRFRFVVLDHHTRPLDSEAPISVEIWDSGSNRVKLFKNITLTHGVYTNKFQLSEFPLLGFWTIKVILGGTYNNFSNLKSIKIENYILPKFSVYLKAPSHVILDDGNIKVALYGKYTFDKFVEGNATIELHDPNEKLLLEKNVDVESISFVDFDIKNLTLSNFGQNEKLTLKAFLSEKVTGVQQMASKSIILNRQRYELVVPYNEIEFENSKPYSIKVYVRHWTGAPVLEYKTPVTMEHGGKLYESVLDKTGAATFEFEHDANDNHKFQFKDSKAEFPNIYTSPYMMLNNREYYCRLKVVTKKLRLGSPVLIEVSSIVNIPYLMYTVMGHASIVRHEIVKVPPNQKSHIIEITPSIEMVPHSFLYVWYIHKGHLRYEETFLSFPEEFENKISLSAPKQVKPGEEVTITVNAQPQSYIGLLAVDLGVYILDNSYDIYETDVFNDLRKEVSYSTISASVYPGILSGLITLTNSHYPVEYIGPAPASKGYMPPIHNFRQNFPETWIFDNYFINDTETNITLKIPDTITTWRITAFANNNVTGFGLLAKPTDINTIQSFFMSLNLPYSVKRGEIVTVPVTIFNYFNQVLDVEVTLWNDDMEFYFMESTVKGVEKSIKEQQQTKFVAIAAGKGKTVKFLIYTVKAGDISLKVTANSSLNTDAVLQKLKVEPEGVPKQQNKELYLSIPKGEKVSTTLKIEKPKEYVPDSEYITFSVGGHYLVPTLDGFQELIQMPTGSGDQVMVNFAPSVLILQYLKANEKLEKEKELVERLQATIEVGYQQQLSFRHSNGGYSVFGMDVDEEPSTWLTAYVVRFFLKASEFLDIENSVIESDLNFLAQLQEANGEFLSTGYLLDSNKIDEYELTAFVLLAFLESPRYAEEYKQTIENAVGFLNTKLNNTSTNSINSLSLMASCFKRSKLRNAGILINELNSQVQEKDGLKWWSANDHNLANDVEITANAALALLDTAGDHTPILKWLIQQRNAKGGFKSCYDTVVGLEALVKFSHKYKNIKKVDLKVSYTAKDELGNEVASNEIEVDSNNVLSFQKHELPQNTSHITFDMQGNGASLIQLNFQYNVANVQEFRHFNIQAKPLLPNAKELILQLCFAYLPDTDALDNDISNMVIIEVNLPSGYRCSTANRFSFENNMLVQKYETKNLESVAILYLDELEANENHCLEILADKVNEILMPKPAPILIYDYYNLSRSNTEFYSLESTSEIGILKDPSSSGD